MSPSQGAGPFYSQVQFNFFSADCNFYFSLQCYLFQPLLQRFKHIIKLTIGGRKKLLATEKV